MANILKLALFKDYFVIGLFLHICVNHCNHKIACALYIQNVITNVQAMIYLRMWLFAHSLFSI